MNSKLLSKTLCLVVLFGVIILQSENAMNGSVHNITLEQLAEKCGTINYELLCTVGARIPRLFID